MAGGEQRAIEGQQLQEGYAKWEMSQPWANPWLQQFYAPTVGTPTIANVTRKSTLDTIIAAGAVSKPK